MTGKARSALLKAISELKEELPSIENKLQNHYSSIDVFSEEYAEEKENEDANTLIFKSEKLMRWLEEVQKKIDDLKREISDLHAAA